jgi:GNAT superfamily N-acetyltransferase
VNAAIDRLAVQVNWRNLALGHATLDVDHATFVIQPAHPAIHDANFIHGVTADDDRAIDALLARARAAYPHCRTLTFRVDPDTPARFEARLGHAGTERPRVLVMLLDGALPGTAAAHDIRPLDDPAGWAAMAELRRADWREHARRHGEDPHGLEIPDGLTATCRLKCPPVRYFMAWVDGRPVGYFNGWGGMEGIGQVEDLYVLPAYRHRGIGTALIHCAVAEARAQGARGVVICADPADTPKSMYAAMGWRPVAMCRQYGIPV